METDYHDGLDSAPGDGGAWLTSESALQPSLASGPQSIDTFEKLINGLPEQIALIDSDWTIVAVNEAWRQTAAAYGFHHLKVGTNYRTFCADMAADGHRSAATVLKGIDEIIAGKRDFFRLVYTGSGEWEGHEFQLRINMLELAGSRYATVTRYDVTELVQLRRIREGFSCSVMKSQEEERRRMGRELHDSTMQLLAGLGLALGQLKRSRHSMAAGAVMDEMEDLLMEAQRELRSIAYLAHPPQLEKSSLVDAIRTLVDGFGRRAGLEASFDVVGLLKPTSQAVEVAAYRVVQEALSNVHRHARAKNLAVKLIGRRNMVHAIVADDGVGMPADVHNGVGLLSMRARVSELGGRLFVRPMSPGTMVVASLPLEGHLRAVGDLALSA